MTKRISARERFYWNGWEFRLSHATSTEAHWMMTHGSVRIRLLFRDIKDPAAPPEWTARMQMHGVAESSGVAPTAEVALKTAMDDFQEKLVLGIRLYREIAAGKKLEPPSD